MWTELIWHKAETSGRLLWARLWTCGFLCIYWVIRTSSIRMWLWDQREERGTKPTAVFHENCQHYPYQTKREKLRTLDNVCACARARVCVCVCVVFLSSLLVAPDTSLFERNKDVFSASNASVHSWHDPDRTAPQSALRQRLRTDQP